MTDFYILSEQSLVKNEYTLAYF